MHDSLRLVFMGTPRFAVPSLHTLLALDSVEGRPVRVVGVFTQPDRPAGRGRRLQASPVKEVALEAGLPVYQPERLRRPEAVAALAALAPDLIVVAAYAQILSQAVLDLPPHGCLNVHASLLPHYRGAAPIQAAILAGESETGVCMMQMDAGLDTGPVLACAREPILPTDTADSLGERLSIAGAALVADTVPAWLRGDLVPRTQDATLATTTHMLRKEDGFLDWTRPAVDLERQVRAMFSWPGAFTIAHGQPLKVLEAAVVPSADTGIAPGILVLRDGRPIVGTARNALALVRVQPAGKRPMPGTDWLRGAPGVAGTALG